MRELANFSRWAFSSPAHSSVADKFINSHRWRSRITIMTITFSFPFLTSSVDRRVLHTTLMQQTSKFVCSVDVSLYFCDTHKIRTFYQLKVEVLHCWLFSYSGISFLLDKRNSFFCFTLSGMKISHSHIFIRKEICLTVFVTFQSGKMWPVTLLLTLFPYILTGLWACPAKRYVFDWSFVRVN